MRRLPIAVILSVLGILVACAPRPQQTTGVRPRVAQIERQSMSFDTPAWQAIDKLIAEQKLEEARKALAELRTRAAESGNNPDWTRALIRELQLATALGSVETAVRALREAQWPRDAFSQLLLELYYAGSLLNYLDQYAWEINQRERVQSQGPLDLKLWTHEQIVAEALRALARVWQQRDALSGPASLLGPYVTPGNYPAGIRDTLRDVVSYHLVELLANTSYWRPGEQNELFRLDHAALLRPGPAVALDDAAQHPLRRAIAVLDDLAAWHTAQGHAEAAFEVELERLRRLHAAFTQEAPRAAQTRALEALLGRSRKLGWWARGQFQLAQWAQEDGELARAHRLALEGARAQADALATGPCARLVAELEAPSFGLSGMLVDGPARRSIAVEHRNLKQLHFRAYAADLGARLTQTSRYELLPDSQELQAILQSQKPVASWSVGLPELGDFDSHTTYVTPPLEQLGAYHVIASARADFAMQDNRVLATPFVVSKLAVRQRSERDGSLEVSVFEGDSGQPAGGVELSLYAHDWGSQPKKLTAATTDARGLARLAPRTTGVSSFLLARRGEDVSPVLGNVWLYRAQEPGEQTGSLVFTDRSVYRPGQTVQLKVLAYKGRDASWKNLGKRKLIVSLQDANGEEVGKLELTTNAYGTAAGSFVIPSGRLLGAWSVSTSLGGSAQLQVEEYKRPTFEVELLPLAAAARLGQPVSLRGSARYYFGLPVQAGRVTYKVERQERYPWWWCWWRPPQRPAQVVASGSATLDAQGQFAIAFTPAADPQLKKGVQLGYRVSVDLTDDGGETRSAKRDFVLGQVAIDARLELPGGFLLAGQPAQVALKRTNLDGDARPGKGRYRVIALRPPERAVLPADRPRLEVASGPAGPRTQGDELRPRHAPEYDQDAELASFLDGSELSAADVETDAAGEARLALPALPGGAYRIRYDSQDEYGERLEVQRDFLVADAHTRLPLASVLKLEQTSVPSGGVLRVLAGSGLPDQALALEISQDGKLVERRALPPGAPVLHELPIGAEQRGGLAVTLVGVRDYQSLEQSQAMFVPWLDRELTLELSSFRDTLRPGAKEQFRVTVRGAKDRALVAAAELLAYMYDRSLDAFAPHTPPAPLSLYPNRGSAGFAHWGLTGSAVRWVYDADWYRLPEVAELHDARLEFPSPYAFGGPGARGRHYALGSGGGLRMQAMAEGAPAPAAAPRPAPVAARAAAKGVAVDAQAQDKASSEPPPAAELRSNFAETAFFLPSLLTAADGSASVEFTVPDSVTEWNVWLHAITRDFRSGSLTRKARSVKGLLVRPYLPRFVREADEVALKVAVQNASAEPLSGELTFEIFDPVTQQSLAQEFGVAQGKLPFALGARASTTLTVPIRAPRRVGDVAMRVIGKAGALSDGELRPLPLLPSRLHLTQSKVVTLRGEGSKRTLSLPDLAAQTDLTRTHEQLVVSVDAQLFMTVLKALPYLVDYPYECSEQTLNRFLSSAIVASVFEKNPVVKRMAQDLSQRRSTLLDRFDAPDPNRTTRLEESPWLVEAQGGPELDDRLIKVLDPQVAQRERDRALDRLQKMQLPDGAFPWFPGGPPSPYMTVYLLIGLARASEFQVAVPDALAASAWQYVASHYRAELAAHVRAGDAAPELVTLIAYALSAFPAAPAFTPAERTTLLDYAYARWTKLPPLLKSLLSLCLLRADRKADAQRVFASVMDSAQTTEDEGTFWKPEERAWLWYNDHIETHAMALRTLLALDPKDPKVDGLVTWLLLHKKLNQWKSTRATAEVIYSLVQYLNQRGALGAREVVSVALGRAPAQELIFEPGEYRGKAQIVVPGADVRGDMARIEVSKRGQGVAFAAATWRYATDELPAQGRGDVFEVARSYFRREAMGSETKLVPLAEGATLAPGDEVEVQLTIKSRAQAEYVQLRDPRPAGLEPPLTTSRYHFDLGLAYYEEVRDSATNFFIDWLPAGEYTLKYRLRANLAGVFRVGPASLSSMYAPELSSFSSGHRLIVR